MGSREQPTLDRRTALALFATGTVSSLAGCGGDGSSADGGTGGTDGGTTGGTETESTPEDTVPDAYRTATALGGMERDPGDLLAKDAVSYQAEPRQGEQCSSCMYYIEDKNDDGMGACAIVEGTIDPEGWCSSYVVHEQAENGDDSDSESLDAVSVPEDASCTVCNMQAAKFSEWNAQAVHEDDTRAFFCTSGCATTYYAVPEEFAETDAAIAGIWMTGFESGEFIDGTEAYYALETDSDRIDDPMRLNPAPFADRSNAVTYVDEVEYLTEADIVELSAFDRELATQYRESQLE